MNYYRIITEGEYLNTHDKVLIFQMVNEEYLKGYNWTQFYFLENRYDFVKGLYHTGFTFCSYQHETIVREDYIHEYIRDWEEGESSGSQIARLIKPLLRDTQINKIII